MSPSRIAATISCIALAAAIAPAVAQSGNANAARSSGPSTAPRDPGDPKAAVPAVRYTSAFGRYRPNAEVEVGAWRERNDAVGRIGGWRVYGREASAPESAPGKPTGEADARANGGTPGSGGAAPGHGHGR